MSGHSKWATTKHRKAAQDAKRGAMFSKLSRAITVAAKVGGGGDPENNASLATAIAKARSYSLPKDKIETAIAKGVGGGEGENFEEIVYEGYGPGGVALYLEALTDNRNRTAADVRAAFSRANGNLATTGSVAFQFERKGEIRIEKSSVADEEELLLAVSDAGAEDMEDDGESFTVVTSATELAAVRDALGVAGIEVSGAELVMRPLTPVAMGISDARKVIRLIDALEELDDIQEVFHNMEVTDELMNELEA